MGLLIYAIYLAASVSACAFILRVKCPEAAIFGLLTSLLIPPFGLLFALTLRRSKEQNNNVTSVKNTLIVSPVSGDDVQNYRVPMSEALVLNNHVVCCALLMDALKNDPTKHLSGIREALAKGDPETAHYAAAAVMEMQRVLLNKVRQLGINYQKRTYNYDDLSEYVKILKKSIKSQLFDSYNESLMQASLEEVLNYMIEAMPSPKVFSDRIELAIHKRNYIEALRFANEYLTKYPDEEDAYLYSIQCLTALRYTASLQVFINDLKHRSVNLTAKTIEYIQYLKDAGIVA